MTYCKIHAFFAFLSIMTACSPKAPESENVERGQHLVFDIHGHRGARGLMPENTIEGFLLALSLGVDVLEMDVVITVDSQVVVSHEPWISAAICLDPDERPIAIEKQLDLNIYKMTYAEVRKYDCGTLPNSDFALQQRIPAYKPLLSEVIAKIEEQTKALKLAPVRYNIETKCSPEGDGTYHPAPETFCRLVAETVKKAGVAERVIFQSFDVRTLQVFHRTDPTIPLSLLIAQPADVRHEVETLGFTPQIYSPNFRGLNAELVKTAHNMGMKVIPWTVNDEGDMTDLLEMGVDGLITDYPDLAVTLRQ